MLYTAGHSKISSEEFLALTAKAQTILDVRSHPSSRWPQYNEEAMRQWIPAAGRNYELDKRLGGWSENYLLLANEFLDFGVSVRAYCGGKFPKQIIAQDYDRTAIPSWTNRGLRDYAYFMTVPSFLDAAEELFKRVATEDIVIICCEALYYKCHRSMIADYALFRGIDSIHLNGRPTKTKGYRVSEKPHSQIIGDRLRRYDRHIIDSWIQYVNDIGGAYDSTLLEPSTDETAFQLDQPVPSLAGESDG